MEKNRSQRNCCVVNCSNHEASVPPTVKFYRFPGKNYEKERKQRWIVAINRINSDGTQWQPTKNSRVCSDHFVGGAASSIKDHPAYIPTIFPEVYRKKRIGLEHVQRFQRAQKRMNIGGKELEHSVCSEDSDHTFREANGEAPSVCSIGTQVSFPCDDDHFEFVCQSEKNNKCVQIYSGCNAPKNIEVQDQSCGSCEPLPPCGFEGMRSVKKESQLKEVSSVNFEVFGVLLKLLPDKMSVSLANENVLLLFLMKMKLGLSFAALAVLFGVHRTTAARLFKTALHGLYCKTVNFIVWPSKMSIVNHMPQCFKQYYPNTRVILDCTEITTEVPNKVSDRIFMYSHYKGTYTFKFLIGIAPNGYIMFKSQCYGGKASDVFITNNSGILDLLEEGDVVLADKGFPGIHTRNDSIIVIPPFVHNGQLSMEEVLQTQNIASVRVHVERSIQRIKLYKILQHVPHTLFSSIDKVVHMACVLANFLPPIIQNE